MTLEVLCLCEELGGHLPRSHKDDCTLKNKTGGEVRETGLCNLEPCQGNSGKLL